MLKGVNPLLSADVLHALRAMGHGDDLIVADINFPSETVGRQTCLGRPLSIDNVGAPEAIEAILSVMPLDTFAEDAACRMEVVGTPDEIPPVQQEVQKIVDTAEGRHWKLEPLERHAFYARSKSAYCVIRTGERRPYGCFAFRKGIILPDD